MIETVVAAFIGSTIGTALGILIGNAIIVGIKYIVYLKYYGDE